MRGEELKGAYEVQSVRIKASGSKEALKEFLDVLQKLYPILVASPILKNDRDPFWHVFVNVNPFVRGEKRDGR